MIHKFTALTLFSLMVVLVAIPNPSEAALVTKSFSKSSSDEFNQGNITDLLSTDDELSMHLGKKVGTGFYSTDSRLTNFNNVRSIVRGSDNKIHIVWIDWTTTPRAIKYANSSDEVLSWSSQTNVTTNNSVTGVLAKIDGSNRIHIFWSESVVGVNYIKHRVRGEDGNWGSINNVSNSSADGAVADWQAVPQGDHNGNYYDTVTGQWATVVRATTKTIYDTTQNRIFDVPAGKLAVRPRADGNAGYEAELEELRSNYLLNSSFESDSNSDGISDSWSNGGSAQSRVYSRVAGTHASYSQRIQVTGQTGEAGGVAYLSQSTAQGTFAAGESATASVYFSSVSTNTSGLRVYLYALNSSNGVVGSVYSSLVTTAGRVTVNYASLPAGTTAARVYAYYLDAIDEGDTLDVTMDAFQLEKGGFATSFIPTTTAMVTRNADMVTVPTAGWSTSNGTFFSVAGQSGLEPSGHYILNVYSDTNNRFGMYLASTGNFMGHYVLGGATLSTNKVRSNSNPFVGAFKYSVGNPLNSFVDGSPGTPSTNLTAAVTLPATASIGSMYSGNGGYNYSGPISRIVAYDRYLSDSDILTLSTSYNAGSWEGIMRTPVADWQAISQGDHYGNFYDSVTGGLATVSRATTKTIYDPKTSKIHDVPVDYLGVRSRIDGGSGYEAEIEESRTNYVLNSFGESNTAGKWNSWTVGDSVVGTPTLSIVPGIYRDTAQRVQYTGLSGDTISNTIYPNQSTAVGTFAATENAVASVWLKGSSPGVILLIYAYQDNTNLGSRNVSVTPTSTWSKVSVPYTNLPAGTNRCRIYVQFNGVAEGTNVDMTIDAAQIEKGSYATSYIPTTTTAITRNADNVTVPTTSWSQSEGAISVVGATGLSPTSEYGFSWYADANNSLSIYSGNNTTDYPYGNYRVGTTSYYSYKTDVPTMYNTHNVTLQYGVGKSTYITVDGVKSASTVGGSVPSAIVGLPATASVGSRSGGQQYSNGPVARLTVYSASIGDSAVSDISSRTLSYNQSNDLPNPFVEADGDIAIAYNKGGENGVGYSIYSSDSWSVDIGAVATGIGDHWYQNIFTSGGDVYYFYTRKSDNKRYLLKRTGSNWGLPLEISSFAMNYASEIMDSVGDIWVFASDQSQSDKTIKYKKYNGATWNVLDAEAGKDLDYPQVTMDSSGNIYAFYNIGNELAYKIRNKITGQWSSRVMFTNLAGDGETYFPNVRYQKNFQNSPDIIDVLYRQSSVGSGNYNLNYGTIGGSNIGTYLSPDSGVNVLESSWIGGWGANALVANINLASNTEIVFDLRTGTGATNTTITWDPDWTNIGTASFVDGTGNREFVIPGSAMPDASTLPIGASRFIQVKISLKSLDGSSVPTLYDYTLNYLADENDPIWAYPASVPAFSDVTKATAIPHNVWGDQNHYDSLYFDWSGASEPADESGITHYYVYFGTDNTADPRTAGVDKGVLTEGQIDIGTPVSGSIYYLRVTVVDDAGNSLDIPSGQSLFTYKFDNALPQPPTNYSVSPVGWSTTNNFTFTWQAAIDPGSGASEIKGYEYKRAGGGDDWTFIDAAPSISIPNVLSYQDGMNDFYVRSVDNAGNNSGDTTEDWTVIHYYYNGTAPSKPQNVVVTPQQATANNFTFTWEEPLNHNSAIKGYYYSINAEPTLTNSVYTTSLTTGAIPAATEQGLNRFYVVAVDVANDQLLGAVSDPVIFECNTTAPGIPNGLVVSDSSNMAVNDWALTTKWQEPGTGVADHYNVYRSTDGGNFTKIAETGSTGYLDSGLSNTSTYYYKITAVDNASAESAYSSTVSKQPTGKYTEAPIIVSGPEVDAKATNATIVWSTNRASSSFVAYGKDEANLDSKGQLNSVTSHEINLTGLEPGAIYYYKVQSFDENRDYPTSEALSNTYSFRTQAAPGIEDVTIADISLNSAIVSWKTTSSATSKVVFGKGTDLNRTIEDVSGSQVTIHTVRLSELDHSTVYNFKITGVDVDNNQLQSDNYSFSTLVYPRISNVRFEQQKNASTSTLKVTWSSNVPLTSIVEYQESTGTVPKEVVTSKLTSEHSLLVTGLKDNTDYVMTVKGRDAYGNEAFSDANRVKTDFDTRPPEAMNIISETTLSGYGLDTRAQVVVYWETDEPATSQVEYDAGVMGDSYSYKTQEDTVLTTSHVVIISDLKPSMSYHLRAISKDSSKNEGKSENISVLTEQAQASVLDMVISTLQNALGWLFGA